jgi:hypothetical protein
LVPLEVNISCGINRLARWCMICDIRARVNNIILRYSDKAYAFSGGRYGQARRGFLELIIESKTLANYYPINLSYFGILFPLTNNFLTLIGRSLNKKSDSHQEKPGKSII